MIKLSQRLTHLADMVTKGVVLADVGTDHGYLPIYLLQTKRIRHAFALDIRPGPLLRAKEHIAACGLSSYITVRRSDGVAALAPGEADSVLIAGMGGGVMLHILEEGEPVLSLARELILQPQSNLQKVREYLYRNAYEIDREDIVWEGGKFYPMFHVCTQRRTKARVFASERERAVVCRFGEWEANKSADVLLQYLLYRKAQYEAIQRELTQKPGEATRARLGELEFELDCVNAALEKKNA